MTGEERQVQKLYHNRRNKKGGIHDPYEIVINRPAAQVSNAEDFHWNSVPRGYVLVRKERKEDQGKKKATG